MFPANLCVTYFISYTQTCQFFTVLNLVRTWHDLKVQQVVEMPWGLSCNKYNDRSHEPFHLL